MNTHIPPYEIVKLETTDQKEACDWNINIVVREKKINFGLIGLAHWMKENVSYTE